MNTGQTGARFLLLMASYTMEACDPTVACIEACGADRRECLSWEVWGLPATAQCHEGYKVCAQACTPIVVEVKKGPHPCPIPSE